MRTTHIALFVLACSVPLDAQSHVETFLGYDPGGRTSTVLGGVDLDGDLWDDIIVGRPYHDQGTVDRGRIDAYSGRTGALLWFHLGSNTGGLFGHALTWTSDRQGNSVPELVVGEPYWESAGIKKGAAWIVDGAT